MKAAPRLVFERRSVAHADGNGRQKARVVLPTSRPNLHRQSTQALGAMLSAAHEVRVCQRALERGGLNVVDDLLRHPRDGNGPGTKDAVLDVQSGAEYHYHSHGGLPGEHGHFHCFLVSAGMPREVVRPNPALHPAWPAGEDVVAHLVAVSMDAQGRPIGLFAPNRWVVQDAWYSARDITLMLPRFHVDHANPSWAVNRWLTALVGLLRPNIEKLLESRDAAVAAWADGRAIDPILECRDIEICAFMPIDLESAIGAVHDALLSRDRSRRSRRAGDQPDGPR